MEVSFPWTTLPNFEFFSEMRRRVSKWHRKKTYIRWGDRETAMRSKSLELFASEILVSQTGFAFYKNAAGQKCHHVWFYPAQQSLGNLPYQPPEWRDAKVSRSSSVRA